MVRRTLEVSSLVVALVVGFGWSSLASAATPEPLATNNTPSCTYALDQVPPDASEIRVYFNNSSSHVPQNSRNGWTYSAASNAVTFHGSTCDSIQSGRIADIDIVVACGDERR